MSHNMHYVKLEECAERLKSLSSVVDVTQTALASKKRGRKRDPERVAKKENERLRRENERLKKKLEQAELVIEVQKKLSRLLDLEDDQKNRSC